jgi:hypothetical protein
MTTNLAVQQAATAEAAKAKLAKEELALPPEPPYPLPKLPLRLSDLGDDDLMKLFVALTRWTDYLAGCVALAAVDERSAESVLQRAEATVLLRDWGGGKDDRVTIAKAQRSQDAEVQKWQGEYDVAHAYRKLVDVMFTSAERDASVVSRELTRRVGRRESNERRTNRWNA